MEPGGRVRYRVVAFAVGLAGVTYLDRICISTLAPSIMRDLSLTKLEMSYVFSAFAVAYAAFEVPSAWWGERVGTRRVLTRIVCWWSAFTIATAAVWSYTSMLAIRFLFGAGEAGAWPNAARTFSRWIPAHERGRVQGVFFAGAFLAGGLTPALVAVLEPRLGWRGVFACFGLVGFVWAAAWYRWFRDEPAEHPAVGPAELALITAGRGDAARHGVDGHTLRALAVSPSAWALCLGYFSNSYGSYFVMTWLPTYLAERRGFTAGSLALYSGLPMLLSVVSGLLGGIATDLLARRHGLRIGRVSRRRGQLRGRGADDGAVGRYREPAGGGRPARHRHGGVDVLARRPLGGGHRHRRRPRRRAQRVHEHDRPDRQHQQPDRRRLAGAAVRQLGACRST